MKYTVKKILSILCSLMMLFSNLPVSAFAEEAPEAAAVPEVTEGTSAPVEAEEPAEEPGAVQVENPENTAKTEPEQIKIKAGSAKSVRAQETALLVIDKDDSYVVTVKGNAILNIRIGNKVSTYQPDDTKTVTAFVPLKKGEYEFFLTEKKVKDGKYKVRLVTQEKFLAELQEQIAATAAKPEEKPAETTEAIPQNSETELSQTPESPEATEATTEDTTVKTETEETVEKPEAEAAEAPENTAETMAEPETESGMEAKEDEEAKTAEDAIKEDRQNEETESEEEKQTKVESESPEQINEEIPALEAEQKTLEAKRYRKRSNQRI